MNDKFELSGRGLSMFIILSIVNTFIIAATAVIFTVSVINIDTTFRYKCTEIQSSPEKQKLILCGK